VAVVVLEVGGRHIDPFERLLVANLVRVRARLRVRVRAKG